MKNKPKGVLTLEQMEELKEKISPWEADKYLRAILHDEKENSEDASYSEKRLSYYISGWRLNRSIKLIREIEKVCKIFPYRVYAPYLNYISDRLSEISKTFRENSREIETRTKKWEIWETDPYDMKIIGDEVIEIISLYYSGGWKEILKELKKDRKNLSRIESSVYSFVDKFYKDRKEEVNENRLLAEVKEAVNRMILI